MKCVKSMRLAHMTKLYLSFVAAILTETLEYKSFK